MGSSEETATVDGIDPVRQALLKEARTMVSEQLGQIDKIDDAAVRTVRITLVILGILAAGPRVESFPDLGFAGAIGTWALLGALIAAAGVYGTSRVFRVFIGSAPDRLAVDYRDLQSNSYPGLYTLRRLSEMPCKIQRVNSAEEVLILVVASILSCQI